MKCFSKIFHKSNNHMIKKLNVSHLALSIKPICLSIHTEFTLVDQLRILSALEPVLCCLALACSSSESGTRILSAERDSLSSLMATATMVSGKITFLMAMAPIPARRKTGNTQEIGFEGSSKEKVKKPSMMAPSTMANLSKA